MHHNQEPLTLAPVWDDKIRDYYWDFEVKPALKKTATLFALGGIIAAMVLWVVC